MTKHYQTSLSASSYVFTCHYNINSRSSATPQFSINPLKSNYLLVVQKYKHQVGPEVNDGPDNWGPFEKVETAGTQETRSLFGRNGKQWQWHARFSLSFSSILFFYSNNIITSFHLSLAPPLAVLPKKSLSLSVPNNDATHWPSCFPPLSLCFFLLLCHWLLLLPDSERRFSVRFKFWYQAPLLLSAGVLLAELRRDSREFRPPFRASCLQIDSRVRMSVCMCERGREKCCSAGWESCPRAG